MTRDRETARRIAQEVQPLGGSVYYVGGCVRDRLLGRESKDLDIEVHGITPQQLEIVLDQMGGRRTVGASFGVYGLAGCGLDIAMPRRETAVGRGHRDFTVEVDPWLGPERAARRRDFTVNAMAYHPQRGLLDCFGGEEDIKNKIIRCVGDPKLRFEEDALRILRAVRFSAVLGFSIQQESSQAACDKAKLLCEISAERICEELCKALCGRWVSQTFALREVWGQIFPELDVLGDEIQRLPEDAFLRLIWLYHSQGKRAKDILVRLKAPKAESKREEALWEILQNTPKTVVDFRRCLNAFGEKTTEDFLSLLFVSNHLDEKARQQQLDTFARAKEGCCSLSDLQVDGRQLLEAGCPKGKKVGEILNQLLEECMQEVLQNHTEKLIERAKQLF